MKVLLLHPERDVEPAATEPWNAKALAQDLALPILWQAMAADDELVAAVVRQTLLASPRNDAATILHRQGVLRDCLAQPDLVRDFYDVACAAIEKRKHHWFSTLFTSPPMILRDAVSLLELLLDSMRDLRHLASRYGGHVHSFGLKRLLAEINDELDDTYLAVLQTQLRDLHFRGGALLRASLDGGNRGTDYRVLKPRQAPSWWSRLRRRGPPSYSFQLAERDEAGARALTELESRGINRVANVLGQAAEHVLDFFKALCREFAFYKGCLNLYARLTALAVPTCLPQALAVDTSLFRGTGLCDACLALQMGRRVQGNDVDALGKSLIVIAGPNQGGKSSFLRAVGVAQLMMQAGMFVTADAFEAALCDGLYTHHKCEEDTTMESGKFDEELRRMSEIVDHLTPQALMLFNESFAATNEREGSEIATQIVRALRERQVRVLFVTHLYGLACNFQPEGDSEACYLRAERREDGTRTFRLLPDEPSDTSHGRDIYLKIFGAETDRQ